MTRQEIIDFCLTFPGSYEDYPFDKIIGPDAWTAMRHGQNKKTFAFLYERRGRLCLNLKCDPLEGSLLRQMFKGITPAYHMNKEHWNTVEIPSDVPDEEIRRLIERSYELVRPKMAKRI